MNKSKLLFFVTALLMLIVAFAACSSSGEEQTTDDQKTEVVSDGENQDADQTEASSSEETKEIKTIGVSLYYKRDEYYKDMESTLLSKAEENGYKFLIQDADADPTLQTSQIESFIASKVDMIMFAPTDPDGMVPAVEAANEAGIPVICFDASTSGGILETVVILDNFLAGEEMGKWAKDYIETELNGDANVVILDLPAAITSCVPRVNGFRSIIDTMEGVTIVAQQDGKASRTDSMTIMENILTANPDVDLVFGINDNTIFGAMAAAETKGIEDIVFIDVGWSDELFERLANNDPYVKASALSTPIDVANKLIEAANRYFAGEKLEETTSSPTYVLTSDNAIEFKEELDAIRAN